MTEVEYLDDLIGKGKGDPDFHTRRWIGDKPKVEHDDLFAYASPDGQFDDSDNAPNDPEQNWDEDLFITESNVESATAQIESEIEDGQINS